MNNGDDCEYIEVIFLPSTNFSKVDVTSGTCVDPTHAPTMIPTDATNPPTNSPTDQPTMIPTYIPTNIPTNIPIKFPSNIPSSMPSLMPSFIPSYHPSNSPTDYPSFNPTNLPITTYEPTHAISNTSTTIGNNNYNSTDGDLSMYTTDNIAQNLNTTDTLIVNIDTNTTMMVNPPGNTQEGGQVDTGCITIIKYHIHGTMFVVYCIAVINSFGCIF